MVGEGRAVGDGIPVVGEAKMVLDAVGIPLEAPVVLVEGNPEAMK
jgi:hypothetical protein